MVNNLPLCCMWATTKCHIWNQKIVEDLIDNFKKHFLELVMNRRKNYTFQGININITEENKLR